MWQWMTKIGNLLSSGDSKQQKEWRVEEQQEGKRTGRVFRTELTNICNIISDGIKWFPTTNHKRNLKNKYKIRRSTKVSDDLDLKDLSTYDQEVIKMIIETCLAKDSPDER